MDKKLTAKLIEQTRMQGINFRPLGIGRAPSDADVDEYADVDVRGAFVQMRASEDCREWCAGSLLAL